MKKTITKVVTILGVLVVVAILWTFVIGPGGVVATVGHEVAAKIDSVFAGMGLDLDLAGIYDEAFEAGGGDVAGEEIIYE